MECNRERRGTKTIPELLRDVMEKRVNTRIGEFLSKRKLYIYFFFLVQELSDIHTYRFLAQEFSYTHTHTHTHTHTRVRQVKNLNIFLILFIVQKWYKAVSLFNIIPTTLNASPPALTKCINSFRKKFFW